MVLPKFSSGISQTDLTTTKTNLNANKAIIQSFEVNLTPVESRSAQHMGADSKSFAEDMCKMGDDHPEIVASGFSITNALTALSLYASLDEMEMDAMSYLEAIRKTKMVVGMVCMDNGNQLYAMGKMASKHDSFIADIISSNNSRYRKQPKSKVSQVIAAGGNIELNNVVPNTRITNNGSTIIRFKAGSETIGKLKKLAAVTIEPNNSALIPAGMTSIIVENLSTTGEANFTVKVK